MFGGKCGEATRALLQGGTGSNQGAQGELPGNEFLGPSPARRGEVSRIWTSFVFSRVYESSESGGIFDVSRPVDGNVDLKVRALPSQSRRDEALARRRSLGSWPHPGLRHQWLPPHLTFASPRACNWRAGRRFPRAPFDGRWGRRGQTTHLVARAAVGSSMGGRCGRVSPPCARPSQPTCGGPRPRPRSATLRDGGGAVGRAGGAPPRGGACPRRGHGPPGPGRRGRRVWGPDSGPTGPTGPAPPPASRLTPAMPWHQRRGSGWCSRGRGPWGGPGRFGPSRGRTRSWERPSASSRCRSWPRRAPPTSGRRSRWGS